MKAPINKYIYESNATKNVNKFQQNENVNNNLLSKSNGKHNDLNEVESNY